MSVHGSERAGGLAQALLALVALSLCAPAAAAPSPEALVVATRDQLYRYGLAHPLRARIGAALREPYGLGRGCVTCPTPPLPLPGELGPQAPFELDLRVLQQRYDIPLRMNAEVEALVTYFSVGPGRPHFQRFMQRGERLMPLFRKILAEEGVPTDLVYVAMIESGFNTGARSPSSAVGPWQFMKPTARDQGLRMDHWVDDRRDPEASTRAAARYLKWLYSLFGDWELAWAAYNAGPGRVGRTIKREGGLADYWALCARGALPAETCRYVPKILAAALVDRAPGLFGVERLEPGRPFEFDRVELEQAYRLDALSGALDLPVETLRELNPALRHDLTPPPQRGQPPFSLRVPPGAGAALLAAIPRLEPASEGGFTRYEVRRGDSFWRIAQAHGVSVEALMEANGLRDARRLRPGQSLLIPTPAATRPQRRAPKAPAVKAPAASPAPSEAPAPGERYEVQAGDTLWSVARRHGVSPAALAAANELAPDAALKVGQRLRLPGGAALSPAPAEAPAVRAGPSAPTHHQVAPGDTLWSLSQRYGCSVEALRLLNGLDEAPTLAVGQRLQLCPPDDPAP